GEDLDWRLDAGIVQVLEQIHGHRIDLFTSRTARDPYSDGIFSGPAFQNVRKYLGFQSLEGSRLTEERSNVDQNILEERVQLARVCLQIRQGIRHPVNLQNEHPSQESSLDCGVFVVGEIDSLALSQEAEDCIQVALRQLLFRF